jgi:hypothetical protein
MKPCLTAVAACLALATIPASALAAGMTATPAKSCYRAGERVNVLGTGFTPNGSVSLTRDSTTIGSAVTDAAGNFSGTLTLGRRSGSGLNTYVATDSLNPAVTASLPLTVSALSVTLRPRRNFRPNVRFRIRATGFTSGRTLWAHIKRGRSVRNVKVGRLRGACRKIRTRRRLLPRGAATGLYTLQFDTSRRYRARRPVSYGFRLSVFRRFRPAASSVAVRRIF